MTLNQLSFESPYISISGGYMESLDNKWILNSDKDTSCSEKDNNSPATLGLENMRGVFILVR